MLYSFGLYSKYYEILFNTRSKNNFSARSLSRARWLADLAMKKEFSKSSDEMYNFGVVKLKSENLELGNK